MRPATKAIHQTMFEQKRPTPDILLWILTQKRS